MIFGICPRISHTSKFWRTYFIMYGDYMVIVESQKGHVEKFKNYLNKQNKETIYIRNCGKWFSVIDIKGNAEKSRNYLNKQNKETIYIRN